MHLSPRRVAYLQYELKVHAQNMHDISGIVGKNMMPSRERERQRERLVPERAVPSRVSGSNCWDIVYGSEHAPG